MSAAAMSTVWENPKFGGHTLLVLLAIGDWSDCEGVSQVSLEGISEHTRLSTARIEKILSRLRKQGDIHYWPVNNLTPTTMLDVRIPMEGEPL
jgi:hypothetical protein